MSTPTPTTPKTANSESSSSSSSSVESNSGVGGGGERDDRIRIVLSPPADHLTATITNVVCSFATKCHLNLRRIATRGMHVEFKKENNMVSMKLRKPQTTASMWSSGKCTCTGAQSERDAYRAARRFCRLLQKLNFKVRLSNYRVVNVLATCVVPFHVDVIRLAEQYRAECSYEPELHPGATFKVEAA
jgi:transcription initiation factor TFIID TATA-box-binding protein